MANTINEQVNTVHAEILGVVRELQQLNEKLFNLKNNACHIVGLDIIKTQDARIVFFDQLQGKIFAVIAMCNLYINAHKNYSDKNLIKIMAIQELTSKTTQQKIQSDQLLISNYLKLSLIDFTYFHIDNFFHNLSRFLKLKPTKKTFYHFIEAVLTTLGYPEETNSFTTLSHIRNSLHNNGIHRNKDYCYKEFIFKKDKKVECASWGHYLRLIEDILEVIKKILEHKKITDNEYIKDDYSIEFEKSLDENECIS